MFVDFRDPDSRFESPKTKRPLSTRAGKSEGCDQAALDQYLEEENRNRSPNTLFWHPV